MVAWLGQKMRVLQCSTSSIYIIFSSQSPSITFVEVGARQRKTTELVFFSRFTVSLRFLFFTARETKWERQLFKVAEWNSRGTASLPKECKRVRTHLLSLLRTQSLSLSFLSFLSLFLLYSHYLGTFHLRLLTYIWCNTCLCRFMPSLTRCLVEIIHDSSELLKSVLKFGFTSRTIWFRDCDYNQVKSNDRSLKFLLYLVLFESTFCESFSNF